MEWGVVSPLEPANEENRRKAISKRWKLLASVVEKLTPKFNSSESP
jgi:hypothetical protein